MIAKAKCGREGGSDEVAVGGNSALEPVCVRIDQELGCEEPGEDLVNQLEGGSGWGEGAVAGNDGGKLGLGGVDGEVLLAGRSNAERRSRADTEYNELSPVDYDGSKQSLDTTSETDL